MTRRMMMICLCVMSLACVWGCDENPVDPGITIIPGSLNLESQTDVDNVAGVVEVRGDLRIDTSDSSDPIMDLSPLLSLKRVGEDLYLRDNKYLPDLTGLANLELIGSSLTIERDAVGESLMGMDSLRGVESLYMAWHDGVTPLGEFITFRIYYKLHMNGISGVEDLSGLTSLDRIERMMLYNMNDLVSLEGVESLSTLSNLVLNSIPQLESLSGLPPMPELREIYLNSLSDLGDLTGLPAVPLLRYYEIKSMDGLTSLGGVDGVESGVSLSIYDCQQLGPMLEIPQPDKIEYLHIFDCDMLETIEFSGDQNQLWHLSLDECSSLMDVSFLPDHKELEVLILRDCPNLMALPTSVIMKDSDDGSSYSNPKLSLVNIPVLEHLDWVTLPVVMSYFSLQENPNLECDLWSLPIREVYNIEVKGNPRIDNCAAFDWAEAMVEDDWQNQVRDNGPCLK